MNCVINLCFLKGGAPCMHGPSPGAAGESSRGDSQAWEGIDQERMRTSKKHESTSGISMWDARCEGSVQFRVVQMGTAGSIPGLSPIKHHLQPQQGQRALPALTHLSPTWPLCQPQHRGLQGPLGPPRSNFSCRVQERKGSLPSPSSTPAGNLIVLRTAVSRNTGCQIPPEQ